MGLDIKIRPASILEIPALLKVAASVAEDLPELPQKFASKEAWFFTFLRDKAKAKAGFEDLRNIIVAENDGIIVGYARFMHPEKMFYGKKQTLLEEIAVEKKFQGQGIGKKLVEEVINSSLNYKPSQSPRDVLYFKAETCPAGFFEKCGFKKLSSGKFDSFILDLGAIKRIVGNTKTR
jgi:N-acetylglutamate synthase-like GNAT family acetyltransferase